MYVRFDKTVSGTDSHEYKTFNLELLPSLLCDFLLPTTKEGESMQFGAPFSVPKDH
jgi:hypothetical protein